MAKKPAKPTSGSRAAQSGSSVPEPTTPVDAAPETVTPPAAVTSESDELEGELTVAVPELEALESRLNERLNSDSPREPDGDGSSEPEPNSRRSAGSRTVEPPSQTSDPTAADGATTPAPERPRGRSGRGFGTVEWAALGGFALLALVGGALFFKFLYAHPAPTQGEGLPSKFHLPITGAAVRLAGAEAGWHERDDGGKAQAEELVLPVITLVLDPGQASSGFVRVEFVDPEDKIRGDILSVAIEGGRFKDGGRGEIIEDGGLKVRLSGTVGFRSHALFSSYMAGQDPRWSVRIKEGADYSNGPWTEIGAALIPNTKH